MNFMDWLLDPVVKQLNRIEGKLDKMTAAFEQAKQNWVDYATELLAQRDAAVAALADAQAKAQEAADALAAFQADDAATDAQSLADQAQAFADELQSALDGVKEAPAEPEPLPEPPAEEAPVE